MLGHTHSLGDSALHRLISEEEHTSMAEDSYLFICFVHVLFQTYNVHHPPPELVPEVKKNHKLNTHGETKSPSKTAQAPRPSAPSPHPPGFHGTFLPRIPESCSSTKESTWEGCAWFSSRR